MVSRAISKTGVYLPNPKFGTHTGLCSKDSVVPVNYIRCKKSATILHPHHTAVDCDSCIKARLAISLFYYKDTCLKVIPQEYKDNRFCRRNTTVGATRQLADDRAYVIIMRKEAMLSIKTIISA